MKDNNALENSYELNLVDKKILDIIQTKFPLAPRPYEVIGDMVGVSELEAFEHVRNLKKVGIIRRLGANFQSQKLGFRSTLCAAKVSEDNLQKFIEDVNSQKGVTHNYLRKHEYNVWFTLIASSWDTVCETLAGISERTGVEILNLPAKKLYKIRVDFSMEDK